MLHALVRILKDDKCQAADSYPLLTSGYEFVRGQAWHDEFAEKEALLTDLAFLVWNCCRRHRSFPETEQWESKVIHHLRAQTPTRDFLGLNLAELSRDVLTRFLIDPAVLLAAWQNIDVRGNHTPDQVLISASLLWTWVTSHRADIRTDAETVSYIEGRLALTAAMASAHMGRAKEWQNWFSRAKGALSIITGAEPYLAMIEYSRLGRLHLIRRFSEVEENIMPLIERFRALSMPVHELKAMFVRANNLKDGGWDPERTLGVLTDVYRLAVQRENVMISASMACGIAQMHGKAGRPKLADCYATIGVRLAGRGSFPFVLAYAVSTWGELLRDRGEFREAIKAYRAGVQEYAKARMYSLVAYMRVVIAETLLMAGCKDEAIGELVLALPVIEREGLVEEAQATVWLLRQATKQTGMGAARLRELRERLDAARQEGAG